MVVDLFSFPQCQVAFQEVFSPYQLAFQGPQVWPVWERGGRKGKADLLQLSGQGGPLGDGLWASSPVGVGLLLKRSSKDSVFFSAQ